MSLEAALQETTEALRQLITALHDDPPARTGRTRPKKAASTKETITPREVPAPPEPPQLRDQPLPVVVALATLFNTSGRTLTPDKLAAAIKVTEARNRTERNAQIDAITATLERIPLTKALHGEDIFTLAIPLIAHWDNLPAPDERCAYAQSLLDTQLDTTFEQGKELIMALSSEGHLDEAIGILDKFSVKKLGEVAPENLSDVVHHAKKALAKAREAKMPSLQEA